MQVFILGLDELECDLVAENELENLKQKEYGKLGLPRQVTVRPEAENLTPYTPFTWWPIVISRLPNETRIKETWCFVCQAR